MLVKVGLVVLVGGMIRSIGAIVAGLKALVLRVKGQDDE